MTGRVECNFSSFSFATFSHLSNAFVFENKCWISRSSYLMWKVSVSFTFANSTDQYEFAMDQRKTYSNNTSTHKIPILVINNGNRWIITALLPNIVRTVSVTMVMIRNGKIFYIFFYILNLVFFIGKWLRKIWLSSDSFSNETKVIETYVHAIPISGGLRLETWDYFRK